MTEKPLTTLKLTKLNQRNTPLWTKQALATIIKTNISCSLPASTAETCR